MHPRMIFIPRVPGVSRVDDQMGDCTSGVKTGLSRHQQGQRGNCIHTQVPSAAPKLKRLGYLYSRIILYSIDHILCPVELSVRLAIIHLSWTEITVRVFFLLRYQFLLLTVITYPSAVSPSAFFCMYPQKSFFSIGSRNRAYLPRVIVVEHQMGKCAFGVKLHITQRRGPS
ncbi:hypothetical protein CPB84DRAFT_127690 [Gymnopilus junonius]|uniref:Uncharacterized protein n=1 Tax=Gymnopilus junonius TaxID=109634 RepID=A0A9P5NG76_GYMJU|nr:hypothetical protein CPB84DRAFT_127690 [Gymnopilus junonius]